ncbi:YadA C-terminal domain-containing protein, partial [uncultured Dialister sp.]|uniref:YadA C-terminal domain-containing protein n=1 Tax=uncultured Dialister sp. TaxID=278064 RepID=UPI0025E45D41
DKWDFAVGYGHYKNANASAVGAFYRPNAGTTVSLAATVGNGDPQISAGVSFKIGMGKNVEKVIITKDKYDAQQKENQEMKEALVNQSQEIEALKQAIMEMKSK